jgi:hypothetical protein
MPKVTFKENHDSLWAKIVFPQGEIRFAINRNSRNCTYKIYGAHLNAENRVLFPQASEKIFNLHHDLTKKKVTYGEQLKMIVALFQKIKTIAELAS